MGRPDLKAPRRLATITCFPNTMTARQNGNYGALPAESQPWKLGKSYLGGVGEWCETLMLFHPTYKHSSVC